MLGTMKTKISQKRQERKTLHAYNKAVAGAVSPSQRQEIEAVFRRG